jgi:plastocyanin
MQKSFLLAVTLLLVGAGCATTSTTTLETTPAPETSANTNQDTLDTTPDESGTGLGVEVTTDVSINTNVDAEQKVVEVTVVGTNMVFDVKEIRVKKGDTVRVTFKNEEGFHDWVIDEFNAKTKQIGAGKEETVEFVADQTGTFEYYCSVGKHRENGMVGTLIVE